MFPPKSSNQPNSSNQKNDENPRILLKDGLRPLGVNPTGRKKASQSAIVMDGNQRSEIFSEAMKLQEEKIGSDKIKMEMKKSSNGRNEDLNAGMDSVAGFNLPSKESRPGTGMNEALKDSSNPGEFNLSSQFPSVLEGISNVEQSNSKNYLEGPRNGLNHPPENLNLGAAAVEVATVDFSGQSKIVNESQFVDEVPPDLKKSNKPWVNLLKINNNLGRMCFEYHIPEIEDGKIVIKPPLSVDIQGREPWKNCLVGYFFEKRVAFHTMEFQANRRWKNRGLIEVIMNEEGFFFFKFGCEEDLLEILEEGVCLIEGKPLILQRWHSQIVLSKDVPKTIPLWVKIYNIPLQYWNL